MQVTQCDRCGELPLKSVVHTKRFVLESGNYEVAVTILKAEDGMRSKSPDLCDDCFWQLVRQAIKEPVAS